MPQLKISDVLGDNRITLGFSLLNVAALVKISLLINITIISALESASNITIPLVM
jgi:hypothetical protein